LAEQEEFDAAVALMRSIAPADRPKTSCPFLKTRRGCKTKSSGCTFLHA
jgi:hypothetical protein